MLSKTRAAILIALIISVALNIFAGGLWLGKNLNGSSANQTPNFDGKPPKRFPMVLEVSPLFRAIPDTAKQRLDPEFMQKIQEENKQRWEHKQRVFETHKEIYQLLISPEFDPAALQQALEKKRMLLTDTVQALDADLLKLVSQFTPEERLAFAENMRSMGKRGKGDPRDNFGHRRHEHGPRDFNRGPGDGPMPFDGPPGLPPPSMFDGNDNGPPGPPLGPPPEPEAAIPQPAEESAPVPNQ